ncbi:MAG: superoxide dismutase [Planctomycetota bacterium]|nr:MAG: superoxide dismutase [Planctomycetota bacterium]
MAYQLPALPYAFDALEPHIDAKTMEIHHDKHHAAYVTNLNKALEGNPLGEQNIEQLIASLDKVPEAVRTAVRNNGGGHANHSLFWTTIGKGKGRLWTQIGKGKGGEPAGHLAEAIRGQLGGFDKFKEDFTKAAMTRFGSGWAWLSLDPKGKLVIESTANQDSPIMHGNTPLVGVDVWEHAYYLLYQNRRVDYLTAFFSVVDWDAVGKRFAANAKK